MLTNAEPLFRALIQHALADERGPKRWHITRLSMYRSLENKFANLDLRAKKCLAISHSKALAIILGLEKAEITETSFPEVDMLALPYADATFDFVVADQTLEHIEGDPFDAVAQCVRVTKPGGGIVLTTCFLNFMHQLPLDFWRFTPQSLALMVKKSGAEVVVADGWGNKAAWTYMELGYRMEKVPEVPGNPIYELALQRDKKWPVHTWVVARKPA